jgi:hypothetical protein
MYFIDMEWEAKSNTTTEIDLVSSDEEPPPAAALLCDADPVLNRLLQAAEETCEVQSNTRMDNEVACEVNSNTRMDKKVACEVKSDTTMGTNAASEAKSNTTMEKAAACEVKSMKRLRMWTKRPPKVESSVGGDVAPLLTHESGMTAIGGCSMSELLGLAPPALVTVAPKNWRDMNAAIKKGDKKLGRAKRTRRAKRTKKKQPKLPKSEKMSRMVRPSTW